VARKLPGSFSGDEKRTSRQESSQTLGELALDREPWWLDFGDQKLTSLIGQALRDNLTLKAAWQRLQQSTAMAERVAAGNLPSLKFDVGASYRKTVMSFGQFSNPSYGASLAASYELDLWGKLSARDKAAKLQMGVSGDELQTLALGICAEVALAYFDAEVAAKRIALLSSQLSGSHELLEVVARRYDDGLAAAEDVYRLRQEVAGLAGQVSLSRAVLRSGINRLAVLVGEMPGQNGDSVAEHFAHLAATGLLQSDLPPTPKLGIPARLLDARPDVRAARRRVEMADANLRVAAAELMPTLRIGASLGLSSTSWRELLDQFVWSALADLAKPVIYDQRFEADVRQKAAQRQERIHAFSEVLLKAVMEVENALVLEYQRRAYLGTVDDKLQYAQAAHQASLASFEAGVGDFTTVLMTLRSTHGVELERLGAFAELRRNRIQLYRALGGAWSAGVGSKG